MAYRYVEKNGTFLTLTWRPTSSDMCLIKSFSSAATSCRSCPFIVNRNLKPSGANFICWAKPHAGAHQLYFKPSEQPRSQTAVPITHEMPVLKRCSSRSGESKGGTHTSLSSPSTSMQISPTAEFISSLVSPRNVNPRNLRYAPRESDTKSQPKRRISMEKPCLCRHQPGTSLPSTFLTNLSFP